MTENPPKSAPKRIQAALNFIQKEVYNYNLTLRDKLSCYSTADKTISSEKDN